MDVAWLAVAQSLGASLFFALGIQFLSLGLRHGDARTGTLIDIATTAAFYWLLSPLFLKTEYFTSAGFLIFVAVGLFRPVISANLALEAVRRLGPTLTSTLTSTTPLFAAVFGILLLGESVTMAIVLGTVAVVLGTALPTAGGKAARPWPIWALVFPLGAAGLRSIAHVLIRMGLAFAPEPLFAGLVAYSVSCLMALAVQGWRGELRRVNWANPGLLWFVAAGIVHGLAVWVMNAALATTPVSIVVPLVSTTPLFTLLLGLVLFHKEAITWRQVTMVVMVVAGVILIAVGR
ncbi:MAG: EamA family transporter [Rhodospirillaceae bacterium]|nr:EamA family transporter [Rhodospirillaceae bacterium]MBT5190727.1 EamA family transporter [Rhodospirillaceae bacterium]MBT5897530.1 EamA family transporter [Rhodospirillaceae bacterium]MBT6429386.1 EamA family transporter [Rhodospirillaceae bacterium]MBT7759923.1 EamA family transporter [Rhodospirillaceae bacterium]